MNCGLTWPVQFYTLVMDAMNKEMDKYTMQCHRLAQQELSRKKQKDEEKLIEFLKLFYCYEQKDGYK